MFTRSITAMLTHTVIAILCLGWFVLPSCADEPPKYKAIDPETIAAYEKLGGIPGGLSDDDNFEAGGFLSPRFAAKKGYLPSFSFRKLLDGKPPKLPSAQVPFGLDFWDLELTDEGLKELKGLKNLAALRLGSTRVTDVGMKELTNLKDLTMLDLSHTNVADMGLKDVKGLKNLTVLILWHTDVTDSGLQELKGCKTLTRLNLVKTKVTDAGVKELKEALPKCNILR